MTKLEGDQYQEAMSLVLKAQASIAQATHDLWVLTTRVPVKQFADGLDERQIETLMGDMMAVQEKIAYQVNVAHCG